MHRLPRVRSFFGATKPKVLLVDDHRGMLDRVGDAGRGPSMSRVSPPTAGKRSMRRGTSKLRAPFDAVSYGRWADNVLPRNREHSYIMPAFRPRHGISRSAGPSQFGAQLATAVALQRNH
jgi:hypothetical protein